MSSMYFTEEHEVFRASFKNFLQKEVVPFIDDWEKSGTIDRFIWKKFGDMGYFGLRTPEEYGGSDASLLNIRAPTLQLQNHQNLFFVAPQER